MTRTTYDVPNASNLFSVRAVRISTACSADNIKIATVSSLPPRMQNVLRMPMVEHSLQLWPSFQPYVHDTDVVYRGSRYRIFYRRHKRLPINVFLSFRGEIIIMRLGKKNVRNVVNARQGDARKAQIIAQRFAPHLRWFQERRGRQLSKLIEL
ncbi:hypothetical protein K435DRAFT_864323 [Dendrothele bispora CBS 962.96]|uniref:Uncharacterized protein n=1 Tax=Dendrothele bispora (strain CBS 962.96) TaxID=1314807 RepID=A0A4S8LM55_DENBC|nr:hypothetical protein K435DRAFT_864323 [Dendrothele bispora CBS 962.96]